MKWVLLGSLLHLQGAQSVSTTGDCDTIYDDIRYGPSVLLANLTNPAIYDSQKRPNSAYVEGQEITDEPDDVYVTLYINSVIEVDPIKQTLTTSLIERETWTDKRLLWDINTEAQCVPIVGYNKQKNALALEPKQFEGVDKIIWTPSLDIINLVEREYGKKFAISHPDATTSQFVQQEITTSCPMKFGKYPFDKHNCYFDVSTFQHSDKDVSLHPGADYPIINNDSALLDISRLTTDRVGQFVVSAETTTTSYQGKYYTLRGELKIERNGDIFAVDIMLPDILLHISIYVSFWLPADSPPARVSLCIISALSFRIMRNSISEYLPTVSYAIWVVDYMAASQAIAVIALIQYALVCYYASFEHVHEKVFKQFKKSKIPAMIKKQPAKAIILFKEAKLQYEEFTDEADNAVDKKSGSSGKKSRYLNIEHLQNFDPRHKNHRHGGGTIDSDIQSEKSIDLAISSFDFGITDGGGGGGGGGGDRSAISVTAIGSSPKSSSHSSMTFTPKSPKSPHSQHGKKGNQGGKRRSVEFEQLNFNLSIPEVMVIAHVRAAFKQFDADHNGVLRVVELQKCLRHFGKYYSLNQVCSLIAAYRQSQGYSLGQFPTVNLADFFCIMVELDDHEPLDEFVASEWFSIPPSHLLDIWGRIFYPVIVLIKIMIFFTILQYYT